MALLAHALFVHFLREPAPTERREELIVRLVDAQGRTALLFNPDNWPDNWQRTAGSDVRRAAAAGLMRELDGRLLSPLLRLPYGVVRDS